MSKFVQENFAKLQNIVNITNRGGSLKENSGGNYELLTISENVEDASVSALDIKTLTTSSCNNLQSLINLFDPIGLKQELEDQTTVLLLKIPANDLLDDLNPEMLEDISKKCFSKSIVIFVTSTNSKKASIYWKSKDIQQLITLVHYEEEFMENDAKIFNFVADYLAKSLSKGKLGLYSEWLKYSNGNEVGAHLLADTRDYNLLLIAAESGNAEVVEILLNCGASAVADDGVSAQDLAWKHRHSEVLLVLAQANLPYPDGIDITQLSDDFNTFYKKTEQLHAAIIAGNQEIIHQIINKNKNLKFYFDLSNKSAARVAVDAKVFDIYETLVVQEIFLAPHEYQQGIFDKLIYDDQKLIRELHNKHSKDFPDKHINILMAHSLISHDVPDAQGKLKYVYEAYKYLSQDSRLSTILKVVAASKNARIIYDFNRDVVNIADPTTSGNTEGVFYPMGRIYIGARQLLNEATRGQAIGTLAHELCHYAVNLAYCNNAKPYKRKDKQTKQKFEKINKKCQKEKGKEEVVDLVHECYKVDVHHAELIVRPAHLIAMYQDQPEKIAELGQIFPDLFEFFERIVKEMKAAIPEIERRDEVKIEKKDQKISKLRKKLVLSGIFSVIGIIAVAAIVAIIFYKPIYNFKELSESNKLKVKNASIIYKNIEVKFHDLFPDNSTAYSKLTSDHISKIFSGHALDFSESHFQYLNDLIHHDWENLAGKLKRKFLTSNFTFQNESLKFEKLAEINSETFNSLNSEQIVDVLDGKELVIGKMIENKTEFYVERKFIFEEYEQSFNLEEFTNIEDTFNDVIKLTSRNKIFILSSEAGAGKTVTFKQLAISIKRKFKLHWVSYIDLKDYVSFYNVTEKSLNVEDLLEKILNLSSKNEFERKLFKEFFKTGRVVLLWNGFDEISLNYGDLIANVLSYIYTNTSNVQYVCTRPLYSDQLKNVLHAKPHKIIPLSTDERVEFLTKFFISRNVSHSQIDYYVKKVQELSIKLKFNTPLLLKIIAESYTGVTVSESDNLYRIYEIFMEKNILRWQTKGETSVLTHLLTHGRSNFNIMNIYQKYALKIEFNDYLNLQKLNIMRTKIPQKLSITEISRMGILYINDVVKYEFAHRTFGEFFVAKFIIENIYLDESGPSFETLLIEMVQILKIRPMICQFIIGYLGMDEDVSGKFSQTIFQLFKSKYRKFFFEFLDSENPAVFEMLFKLFQKDHKLLVDLLHVNEDETLYTATFNPIYKPKHINPDMIKNLALKYLKADEFKKFLNGMNQKGKILFGMSFYNIQEVEKVHDEHRIGTDVNLLEFLDKNKENLTENEQRNLFIELSHPTVFMSISSFKLSHYVNLWENHGKLLSKNETHIVIGNSIKDFLASFSYSLIHKNIDVLQYLLNRTETVMSSSEIYVMFTNQKILHHSTVIHLTFEKLWTFLVRHTSKEQQVDMLTRSDTSGKIGFTKNDGRSVLNYFNIQFTILHLSLFNSIKIGGSFEFISNIYESLLSRAERQALVTKSNDFMIFMLAYSDYSTCYKFSLYLEKLFDGNKMELEDFLKREIEPTELTIFEYFKGFYASADEFVQMIQQLYDRNHT